jgi:hypothetical protein
VGEVGDDVGQGALVVRPGDGAQVGAQCGVAVEGGPDGERVGEAVGAAGQACVRACPDAVDEVVEQPLAVLGIASATTQTDRAEPSTRSATRNSVLTRP